MKKRLVLMLLLFPIFFVGCGGLLSKEHLIFATTSNIGVEVSMNSASPSPINFVVGYKRFEGVIDPLGKGKPIKAIGVDKEVDVPAKLLFSNLSKLSSQYESLDVSSMKNDEARVAALKNDEEIQKSIKSVVKSYQDLCLTLIMKGYNEEKAFSIINEIDRLKLFLNEDHSGCSFDNRVNRIVQNVVVLISSGHKENETGGVITQAHSVLAKMNFGALGPEDSASATVAQWFATGKAAEIMAQNGNVAAAVTGDIKMTAKIKRVNLDRTAQDMLLISSIYDGLSEKYKKQTLSDKGKKILKAVDSIFDEDFVSFDKYSEIDVVASEVTKTLFDVSRRKKKFNEVTEYLRDMQSSVDNMKSLIASGASNKIVEVGQPDVPVTNIIKSKLKAKMDLYTSLVNQLSKKVFENKNVVNMIEYVYGEVIQEGEKDE